MITPRGRNRQTQFVGRARELDVLEPRTSAAIREFPALLSDAEILELRVQYHLTPRECDTLASITRGLSDRQIATKLDVGPETVRTHRTHLLGKVGCANRLHLILWLVHRRTRGDLQIRSSG